MNRSPENFGSGSFVGEIMRDPGFFDQPAEEQARQLGWIEGCPVVEELISPDSRGPAAMIERYAEISFWQGHIRREILAHNSYVYDLLYTPVTRLSEESVGKHERDSVPQAYIYEMPPSTTLIGYALPRLMIDQIGGSGLSHEKREDRLQKGFDELHEAISFAQSPEELLIKFADGLRSVGDLSPIEILQRIMPNAWLEQSNANSMLERVEKELSASAPKLYKTYLDLPDDEKAKLGIIID